MGTEKDHEAIRKLLNDWRQVDQLGEERGSIHPLEIKQQLALYQERERKQLAKEIVLFLILAMCVLGSLTVIVLKAPILFIVIQGAVTILGPVVLFTLWKRRKQEGSNLL